MNLTYIENILKQLQPLDVLEVTGLDGDAELLVESLADFIEDNMDDIRDQLIANGHMEEDDE